ncbi:hypothetical protein DPMN_052024 [Dreissena polymorpha]|uniref:Uncharacterized protein n=1 Tax=Dreissena polymorpha TaxID=45954 RepID=A0A9D4CIX8_DREPO|nr:hypothetical protein DPMN_052024 [Dreissena polymorpha]
MAAWAGGATPRCLVWTPTRPAAPTRIHASVKPCTQNLKISVIKTVICTAIVSIPRCVLLCILFVLTTLANAKKVSLKSKANVSKTVIITAGVRRRRTATSATRYVWTIGASVRRNTLN